MKYPKAVMTSLISGLLLAGASPIFAQEVFTTGPVIEGFGPNAAIPGAEAIPADAEFHVAFNTSTPAEEGELNRTLVSAARFINMHGRAGVDPDNIHIGVVIHGRAVRDVADVEGGQSAANAELIAALLAHNVDIYVCGQSAAYYEVATEDLLPGVTMALSAMTAHAQLQQAGYTLNPF
ncbi:DsrE family protein [Hyphobacterium sp.]|uniref:DsrE family protein n=1 Tax=Hyphobacterium sp. TaxID=2004662 RepID=UPI003748D5F2